MTINKNYIKQNLLNKKNQLRTNLFREDSKWFKNNQYIIKSIYYQTNYLDINEHNINERLYIIYNELTLEDIICPSCKNSIKKFITFNRGYRKYCSKECGDRDVNRINKIKSTKRKIYGDETFNNRDKAKETIKEKYGVENVSQIEKVKNRAIETAIKKYGSVFNTKKVKKSLIEKYNVNNPMKSKKIKEQSLNSRINKYGSLNNFEKIKETNIKKYGVAFPLQNDKIKENMKYTSIKKYNVDHPMKSKEIKDKVKSTKKERYGDPNYNNIEKYKKTTLERYGVQFIFQNEKIKKDIIDNNLDKYGVAHINQKDIRNYNEWIENDKFIEVYNKYDNIEDICKYFNVSHFPVYKRARKLNLLYKPNRKDVTIKKIGKTIESFSYSVEYNNRSIIKPLELDIVIRKNNSIVKTLEYNGLLYHSIGISSISKFNNWDKYKDNLVSFIDKDRIKLDKCRKLNIELLILREDIYLNNPNIIDKWLNNKLNYKILEEPIIYRFKTFNNLESISIEEIETSINSGYRIYFDWIEFI